MSIARFGGHLATASIVCLTLTWCGRVTPTSLAVRPEDRAPAPPLVLQRGLEARGAEFVPLSADELATVQTTAAAAIDAAIEMGRVADVPVTRIGFTYLGRWQPPPQALGHSPMPDPIPAYAVQLLPPSDHPDPLSTRIVIVHATTGIPVIGLAPCIGANCAVQP